MAIANNELTHAAGQRDRLSRRRFVLLEEREHFYRCQQKVAKIVPVEAATVLWAAAQSRAVIALRVSVRRGSWNE